MANGDQPDFVWIATSYFERTNAIKKITPRFVLSGLCSRRLYPVLMQLTQTPPFELMLADPTRLSQVEPQSMFRARVRAQFGYQTSVNTRCSTPTIRANDANFTGGCCRRGAVHITDRLASQGPATCAQRKHVTIGQTHGNVAGALGARCTCTLKMSLSPAAQRTPVFLPSRPTGQLSCTVCRWLLMSPP